MALPTFAFDANDAGGYDAMEMRRRIAMQMLTGGKKGHPKNVGEGLSSIGDAIGDVGMMRALERQAAIQRGVESEVVRGAPPSTYAPPVGGATPRTGGVVRAPAAPVNTLKSGVEPPPPPPPAAATPPPDTTSQTIPADPGAGGEPSMAYADPALASQQTVGSLQDMGGDQPLVQQASLTPNVEAVAQERPPPVPPSPTATPAQFKPGPAYLQGALERNFQNPNERGYYGQLAGKEAKSAREVSPTGAAGPWQFTRGTGAQYGIPGEARFDPDKSAGAVQKFTQDNIKILTKMLGREPTYPEVALAHQQGAVTAGRMLTGTGNASARNLAVNNVPPGTAGPAAAERIMKYYGMPNVPFGQGNADDPRARAAAALMNQPQGPMPPDVRSVPTEAVSGPVGTADDTPSLQPMPPTASLAPVETATDAPPPGMGTGTRDSIANTLVNQPPPVPEVPQANPTMPGATPPTTGALTPPTSSSISPPGAGGVPPDVQVAQARQPGVTSDIPPAPNMPPSKEPIPPASLREFPDPGPAPTAPPIRGPSQAQQYWENIMNNPQYSPGLRAQAQQRYNAEEAYRKELSLRDNQDYVDRREAHQAAVVKKRDWELGKPERDLNEMVQRLTIEKEKALAQNRPNEAALIETNLGIARQNLEELRYKAGTPRAQEAEKRDLELREARDKDKIRTQYGSLPPEKVVEQITESKKSAAAAAQGFTASLEAGNALKGGAITGFGADARLNWAKFMQATGLQDQGNDIANTEVFRASMAPVVGQLLRSTVGSTQISDPDRRFAEDAAGGKISLDAQSITRLLDVTRRMSIETIRQHQNKMDVIYPDNPQAQALFGVDLPVPRAHVERLYANPDKKTDFDQIYGEGAADRLLKRRQR